MQRITDSIVAVHRDEAEVKNRRGTEHDVTAAVDFAKEVSKIPAGLDGPDHTERHDHTAQQKVRGGHGEDQEVGWGLELLEVGDGNDHNQVAHHGHHYSTNHDNVHGTRTQHRPPISRARVVDQSKAKLFFWRLPKIR